MPESPDAPTGPGRTDERGPSSPDSPVGGDSPDASKTPEIPTVVIASAGIVEVGPPPDENEPSLPTRIKTFLIGKPRDLGDESIHQHITLVAFLAWVGLGADGLSSSCYGPAEAFLELKEHSYLAVF